MRGQCSDTLTVYLRLPVNTQQNSCWMSLAFALLQRSQCSPAYMRPNEAVGAALQFPRLCFWDEIKHQKHSEMVLQLGTPRQFLSKASSIFCRLLHRLANEMEERFSSTNICGRIKSYCTPSVLVLCLA